MIVDILNESQKTLLPLIAERDGKLNWYKIERIYINKFNIPAELIEDFKFLESESLIESRELEGKPLARLFITEKDSITLAI